LVCIAPRARNVCSGGTKPRRLRYLFGSRRGFQAINSVNSNKIKDLYAYLFARVKFYRFNKALFELSLHGLGILNYKTAVSSGEDLFVKERMRGLVGPVVFDVGANRGDYSSAVLSANPGTRLFAFEPHPETFQYLAERLAPLGAEVINAACGRVAGHMPLYGYVGGSQHASLYRGVIEDLHRHAVTACEVMVIDLDTFAIERTIEHIDLLKIDAEGHELEVLGGAKRLLQNGRIETIQFEFNEMNLISRTYMRDFYDALPEYRLYRMVRNGLVPLEERASPASEIFLFQNIVAHRQTARP
jgi:FkbM family methyltransferase